MILHLLEVWLVLAASFAVGCGVGWLLYRQLEQTDYAFEQQELAGAIRRRMDRMSGFGRPQDAAEKSGTPVDPRAERAALVEAYRRRAAEAVRQRRTAAAPPQDTATSLRQRVLTSRLARRWAASRTGRAIALQAEPEPRSDDERGGRAEGSSGGTTRDPGIETAAANLIRAEVASGPAIIESGPGLDDRVFDPSAIVVAGRDPDLDHVDDGEDWSRSDLGPEDEDHSVFLAADRTEERFLLPPASERRLASGEPANAVGDTLHLPAIPAEDGGEPSAPRDRTDREVGPALLATALGRIDNGAPEWDAAGAVPARDGTRETVAAERTIAADAAGRLDGASLPLTEAIWLGDESPAEAEAPSLTTRPAPVVEPAAERAAAEAGNNDDDDGNPVVAALVGPLREALSPSSAGWWVEPPPDRPFRLPVRADRTAADEAGPTTVDSSGLPPLPSAGNRGRGSRKRRAGAAGDERRGVRPPAAAVAEPGDDLTRIRGIGRANEARLREIGIRQLAQIAAWSEEEQRWVSAYLGFVGRVEREGWSEQAKALTETAAEAAE